MASLIQNPLAKMKKKNKFFPDLWSFGCGLPSAGGSKTELL